MTTACTTAVYDGWESYQASVIRLVASGAEGMVNGTAFAVNSDGYYVTNHHVVAPAAAGALYAVQALAPQRIEHDVEVIWTDPAQDLAVIRVPGWRNPPLPLYPSNSIRINLPVLSIGYPNSSDSLTGMTNPAWTVPTIKRGIISEAMRAKLQEGAGEIGLFEHSAVVNTGNSGGPLVDECGRVVGVNVAKATSNLDLASALRESQLYGVRETRIDIQEGAFFAIQSTDLIRVLSLQGINYTVHRAVCLGERISPSWLIGILLGMFALFSAAIAAIFFYLRRAISRQLPVAKDVGDHRSADAITDERVFRGEGGEIIHRDEITLECIAGGGPPIQLHPGQNCRLGRDPALCEIVLQDEHVSRVHLTLIYGTDRILRVLDMGSTGGSFIDGQRIATEFPGTAMWPGQSMMLASDKIVYRFVTRGPAELPQVDGSHTRSDTVLINKQLRASLQSLSVFQSLASARPSWDSSFEVVKVAMARISSRCSLCGCAGGIARGEIIAGRDAIAFGVYCAAWRC